MYFKYVLLFLALIATVSANNCKASDGVYFCDNPTGWCCPAPLAESDTSTCYPNLSDPSIHDKCCPMERYCCRQNSAQNGYTCMDKDGNVAEVTTTTTTTPTPPCTGNVCPAAQQCCSIVSVGEQLTCDGDSTCCDTECCDPTCSQCSQDNDNCTDTTMNIYCPASWQCYKDSGTTTVTNGKPQCCAKCCTVVNEETVCKKPSLD